MSVAVLLPGTGSSRPSPRSIEAVLTMAVVADGGDVACALKVAVPPAARLTVVAMLPVPDGDAHVDPTLALHVHVTPVRLAGKVSATGEPGAAIVPAFLAMIVYV